MTNRMKPLMVPATEKGIRMLASMVGRFLPHVTMNGAQIVQLDPLLIREDGDTEDSPCQDVAADAVLILNQRAVVLHQGSRRVLIPLR